MGFSRMSRLTRLQQDLLRAFFERRPDFFLTGGAALAGYYLGHRTTNDLDLFTATASLDDGAEALRSAARDVDASVEAVRTSPDFRRFVVTRGDDACVVDLVRDRAPQIFATKRKDGVVLLDPPEEILANKLCTLLSRAETRDLVDVMALERAGYAIDDAIAPAASKDGGLTPAQLAWVLSQIEIGDDANPPGEVSASELREYLKQLVSRLSRIAFPG